MRFSDYSKEPPHIERSASDPTDKRPSPLVEVSALVELTEPLCFARSLLDSQERVYPYLFSSLRSALHPLFSARNIEKDLKEQRHRKKSVIQMKNGAPVYDSEEGTDEEPVP
ncbi:hypothetical protein ACJJTC_001600 [Scirpophaga incertulas]